MYELENAKAARRRKITHVFMWIILLVLFVIFIFPFLVALLNVFKANADINRFPLSLIGPRKGFVLSNFPTAMEDAFLEGFRKLRDYHNLGDCPDALVLRNGVFCDHQE